MCTHLPRFREAARAWGCSSLEDTSEGTGFNSLQREREKGWEGEEEEEDDEDEERREWGRGV